jgi:hypothetical protein
MKKIILILLGTLVVTNSYAGESHYLTATGRGNHDGSSISNAFSPADFNNVNNWDTDDADDNKIGPADTVYISGIDGDITSTSSYRVLEIKGSGSETGGIIKPITITADVENPPTIWGAKPVTGWSEVDFVSTFSTNILNEWTGKSGSVSRFYGLFLISSG